MGIRKKADQDGVALILAIFALLLLTAIALAMLFSADTETSISVNYRNKQSAIYGALAGLQEARDRIHPISGDLGAGLAGGLNIVPTALPSSSTPNVLYIINPASGETVAPWNPSNQYFDTELCHEAYFVNNFGVTGAPTVPAGTPCPATSASVPSGSSWYAWYNNSTKTTNAGATGTGAASTMETAYHLTDSSGNAIPLTYKWVRITLKADNMTPIGVGTGGGSQVCWNGSHEIQLPSTGYHTDCTPITGAITNIAVTASGSGYTSAPTVTISGGSGSGATATAIVGQLPQGVTSVTLTSPGAGYTSPPTVTITPTDGNGSGATVTAALNANLPVASVSPNPANWASPPACYASGSTPTVSFSPAGATATVTMTGDSCIYGFAAAGSCSAKNDTGAVTATNGTGSGFAGTVTAGSNKKADGSYTPSNPGSYTAVPTTFSVASPCSSVTITSPPTYGKQISSVTVTSGGSYPAGNPPTVTFAGATPIGGSPGGTATLGGTASPGPLTSLSLTAGGSGYDANPTVTIAPPPCAPLGTASCAQATATASIATNRGVLGINITNAGTGYSQANPPTVTFSGGGGSGATATASAGSGGNYMGRVYLLTGLAVTPNGSRGMTQTEVAVIYNTYTFGLGGALTLIGPNPNFGTPHSQNFVVSGDDCPTCVTAPSGCNTAASPATSAIGVDDPSGASNPSAVQTVINALGKPNNYIGSNGAPDVANANLGNPTAAELNEVVTEAASVATNVYGSPSAPVSGPSINLGSAANPSINVVYGDYTMGPTTGYGILVVTGTLSIHGNYGWNGLILVIGSGASVMSGGGNGQITGAVYVANTSGNSFGSPSASWNGGGGNGIQYDHCWADYMLGKIPPLPPNLSANSLQVISQRTLVY